jgi:hypothetical protein
MKKVILILLVIVMIGSGAVLLAQQADAAEPGDPLYSVDVLAEKVQRAIIFDEVKLAEFEGEVLGERIGEYQSLALKSADVEEILDEIDAQQTRVREHIGTMENNPENYSEQALQQVQNRYEEQLEQHIEIMEKVQNQGEETAIQIKQELQENLDSCRSGTCGSTGAAGQQEESGNSEDSGQPVDTGSEGAQGNPNN